MATRYPISTPFSVGRVFDQVFNSSQFETVWSANAQRASLPLDVYATEDEVVVLAAVPGISPESVEITVNKNTVTLSGEFPNVARSESARDAQWYLHELPRGTFRRSLQLPFEIDSTKSEATFEHGMIRLTLPKAEAAKPRQIQVQAVQRTTTPEVTSGETATEPVASEATVQE